MRPALLFVSSCRAQMEMPKPSPRLICSSPPRGSKSSTQTHRWVPATVESCENCLKAPTELHKLHKLVWSVCHSYHNCILTVDTTSYENPPLICLISWCHCQNSLRPRMKIDFAAWTSVHGGYSESMHCASCLTAAQSVIVVLIRLILPSSTLWSYLYTISNLLKGFNNDFTGYKI